MKNTNNFEISSFRDGSLVLSCGDKGMDTDLVFSTGAMNGDPLLKEQKEILDFILKAVKNYKAQKESKK